MADCGPTECCRRAIYKYSSRRRVLPLAGSSASFLRVTALDAYLEQWARGCDGAPPCGAHRYDKTARILHWLTGPWSGVFSSLKKKSKDISGGSTALLMSSYSERSRSATFVTCKNREKKKQSPVMFVKYRNFRMARKVPLLLQCVIVERRIFPTWHLERIGTYSQKNMVT